MVSSIAQTQQSQDFLASQAATQKLQEQLGETRQRHEAAMADERAQEQAHRHVAFACHLVCLPFNCSPAGAFVVGAQSLLFQCAACRQCRCCRCMVTGSPLLLVKADLASALTAVALTCREALAQLNSAIHEIDHVQQPRVYRLGSEVSWSKTHCLSLVCLVTRGVSA